VCRHPRGGGPEADEPGDRTVGLAQRLADFEDGADLGFVAAELPWRQQAVEPGCGHSVDDRVRGLPFGIGHRRVLAQQRLQGAGSGNKLLACRDCDGVDCCAHTH